MGGKLQVDTSSIASAARGTLTIKSRLEAAATDAAALESAIPVSDLRRSAVDFSAKWEINRKKLIEEIDQLQGQLSGVAEAFEQVDSELASRLSASLG